MLQGRSESKIIHVELKKSASLQVNQSRASVQFENSSLEFNISFNCRLYAGPLPLFSTVIEYVTVSQPAAINGLTDLFINIFGSTISRFVVSEILFGQSQEATAVDNHLLVQFVIQASSVTISSENKSIVFDQDQTRLVISHKV